jgi:hypothetical protein
LEGLHRRNAAVRGDVAADRESDQFPGGRDHGVSGGGAIFVTAIWAGLFPELKNARTFEPQYRGKSP